MGTRGFTGFVADGVVSIGYQQYDSYPSGVGIGVLEWAHGVNENDGWREVKDAAAKLILVNAQDHPTKAEAERLAKFTDVNVSTGDDWYSTLRDTQGDPAAILEAGYITHDIEWPKDSLFCEWGYLIDLDLEGGALEVYQGFQNKPHKLGRFASTKANDGYYPVKLVGKWSLRNLPDKETFLKLEDHED